jgi:hypothetical protein
VYLKHRSEPDREDVLVYRGNGLYTRKARDGSPRKMQPDHATSLQVFANYWFVYICPTVQILLDDSAKVYNGLSDKNSNRS